MTRRAPKIDANQREIVQALEQLGCSVVSLAGLADGVPDLLVGYHGANYLLEVKDSAKPPSRRRLTPDQREFFAAWRGQVARVETVQEALGVVGVVVEVVSE